MDQQTKNEILVKHYESRQEYQQLATELRRLLDGDPRFPVATVQIRDRYKEAERLIEKIKQMNGESYAMTGAINKDDFQSRIDDILGLRIVCLRLSQLTEITSYVEDLVSEGKLQHRREPKRMETFSVAALDNDDRPRVDPQYSGYSSIHFVVSLGSGHDAHEQFGELRAEIQLRTIFEEAWGEVDHKYRYEALRSGDEVSPHIQDGFRDLGLYLFAVARHAEHLCEELDRAAERGRSDADQAVPDVGDAEQAEPDVRGVIREKLGREPSERTALYIESRLREHSTSGKRWNAAVLCNCITAELLGRYRAVFEEVIGREPFTRAGEFDLDVVPLVNFVLFDDIKEPDVAEAGLRSALRGRPGRYRRDRW